jgi:hypothetical protein
MISRSMFIVLVLAAAHVARAELKTESFDRDPKWEALNNHVVPERIARVVQDFGYDAAKGALGGRLTRAAKPAYYAAQIEPKTFNNKLSASGTLAISKSGSGSGIFFGWFNANLPEASGRPPSSIGIEIDCENGGGRMAIRAHSANNLSAGKFVTKFERYRTKEEQPIMRPTPIRNDGTRYTWKLDYDPDGAGGNGQVRFTIASGSDTPADFENKLVTFDLPDGFKEAGATFDRFGLINGTKPGGSLTIHFDDLRFDGRAEDFAKDPGWIESGNRSTYETAEQVGAHDFGFSAATNHAGGAAPGEVGGAMWRSGKFAYYADAVGPLSSDDRLEVRGRVVLLVGAPDSDMYLGWFDANNVNGEPPNAREQNFIGIHVGGPTRVGHYFHPVNAAAGPVLRPGKPYDFTFVYDPAANDGHGAATVTLGDETYTHPFRPGHKPKTPRLDHFGLFTATIGGQVVKVYFDDLAYTAKRATP